MNSHYDVNGDGHVSAWEHDAVSFQDGEYPGQPGGGEDSGGSISCGCLLIPLLVLFWGGMLFMSISYLTYMFF